jgi:hypothetical protein
MYNEKSVGIQVEDAIHKCLECGQGVCEAEGHDGEFKMAVLAVEGCFGDILWVYTDLVVGTLKINICEIFCIVEFVKEFINTGKRITVFDGEFVEGTVVDAKTKCTILFSDKEDRSTPQACGGVDVPESKEVFEVLL